MELSNGNQLVCYDGKIRVRFESTLIDVPLNFEDMSNVVLYNTVKTMEKEMSQMKEEIEVLREGQGDFIKYRFKEISNDEAKEFVRDYIKETKEKEERITVFQISQDLSLPADQVEKILEEFESEGRVKWANQ